MNDVTLFVFNIGAWGYMGMNRVSPLEMGMDGGGGGTGKSPEKQTIASK